MTNGSGEMQGEERIEKEQGSPVAVIILGIMLLLGGGAGLFAGFDRAWLGSASESWVEVEGEILSSRVDRSRGRSAATSRTEWRYYARLGYRYEFEGRSYPGSKISYDDPPGGSDESGKRKAETFLSDFPRGATVPVWVNPDNPEQSVLLRGTTGSGVWIPLGFGIVAFSVGAWMTWFGFRLRRKRKEREGDE